VVPASWRGFQLRAEAALNTGKFVLAQLIAHLPLTTFPRCVARYDGEHKVKRFSCLEQFLIMDFAQLAFRESLRDIEARLARSTPRGSITWDCAALPRAGQRQSCMQTGASTPSSRSV